MTRAQALPLSMWLTLVTGATCAIDSRQLAVRDGGGGGASATGGGGTGTGGAIATGGIVGSSGGATGSGGAPGSGGRLGPGGALAVGTGGDFVGAGGAGGAPLTVTSTTFTSGSVIPVMNTCAGADVSPELEWSAGPAGTKGYAVALLDTSAASPIDWIVWDIPAATTSLPARLPAGTTLSSPAGARQLGVGGDGYVGPCPPSAQGQQSYVYGVFAVDVAVLSGLPASATTLDVFSAVSQHMLADGGLLGVSSRP